MTWDRKKKHKTLSKSNMKRPTTKKGQKSTYKYIPGTRMNTDVALLLRWPEI